MCVCVCLLSRSLSVSVRLAHRLWYAFALRSCGPVALRTLIPTPLSLAKKEEGRRFVWPFDQRLPDSQLSSLFLSLAPLAFSRLPRVAAADAARLSVPDCRLPCSCSHLLPFRRPRRSLRLASPRRRSRGAARLTCSGSRLQSNFRSCLPSPAADRSLLTPPALDRQRLSGCTRSLSLPATSSFSLRSFLPSFCFPTSRLIVP